MRVLTLLVTYRLEPSFKDAVHVLDFVPADDRPGAPAARLAAALEGGYRLVSVTQGAGGTGTQAYVYHLVADKR